MDVRNYSIISLILYPYHYSDLPDCILPIAWTYEDKQDGNSAVDEDEACSLTSCSSSSSSASNRTSTSVIMAIQHSEKPFWGVQFHPESICSDHGNELISNFFTLARKWWATSKTTSTRPTLSSPLPSYIKALCQIPSPSISSSLPSLPNSSHKFNNPPISNYRLAFQQITTTTTNNSSSSSALPSSQLVYDRLFSPKHESYSSTPCFWLDSSKVEKGRSTRFSYMGSSDGPLSFSVSYSTATRQITKKRMDSNSNLVESKICLGTTSAESGDGSSTFFDWIKAETMKYNNTMNGATTFNQKESSISISSVSLSPLSSTIDDHYTSPSTSSSSSSSNLMTVDDIPFDFWTGFVGYFGYEMKTESFPASSFSTMGGGGVGGSHPNGTSTTPSPSSSSPVSEFKTKSNHHAAPDSSFLFIDRMIVFDHEMGDIWLVSLHDAAKGACLEEDWFSETRAQLSHLMTMSNNQSSCGGDESFTPSPCPPLKPISTTSVWDSPQISVHHSKQEYMKNITRSIEEIKCGETYEVCLTTQIKIKPSSPSSYSSSSNTFPSSSGYNIYKQLRRRNPAPYAAFLHLSPQLSIACSSPERFLKVDRENWITMKPIKGTLAAARLQDVKDHPIIMNIAMSSSAVSDEEELRRLQQDVVDAENRDRVERLRTSEKDRSENLMVKKRGVCM